MMYLLPEACGPLFNYSAIEEMVELVQSDFMDLRSFLRKILARLATLSQALCFHNADFILCLPPTSCFCFFLPQCVARHSVSHVLWQIGVLVCMGIPESQIYPGTFLECIEANFVFRSHLYNTYILLCRALAALQRPFCVFLNDFCCKVWAHCM